MRWIDAEMTFGIKMEEKVPGRVAIGINGSNVK